MSDTAMQALDGDLTIRANGIELGGWKAVRVTHSLAQMPASIRDVRKYPNGSSRIALAHVR